MKVIGNGTVAAEVAVVVPVAAAVAFGCSNREGKTVYVALGTFVYGKESDSKDIVQGQMLPQLQLEGSYEGFSTIKTYGHEK
jgi:hypothetical protein